MAQLPDPHPPHHQSRSPTLMKQRVRFRWAWALLMPMPGREGRKSQPDMMHSCMAGGRGVTVSYHGKSGKGRPGFLMNSMHSAMPSSARPRKSTMLRIHVHQPPLPSPNPSHLEEEVVWPAPQVQPSVVTQVRQPHFIRVPHLVHLEQDLRKDGDRGMSWQSVPSVLSFETALLPRPLPCLCRQVQAAPSHPLTPGTRGTWLQHGAACSPTLPLSPPVRIQSSPVGSHRPACRCPR